MSRHYCFTSPVVLWVLFALAACGGAGGGTGRGPADITVHGGAQLTPEEFDAAAEAAAEEAREHPGFRNQWGLTHIRADVAYGNLSVLMGPDAEPGAGVTIGVLDTGIDLEHPSISGNGNRTVTEVLMPGAVEEIFTPDEIYMPGAEESQFSNGTAAASVAAGARTDAPGGHHGVAWGAHIAAFAIPPSESDSVYEPVAIEDLARLDAEKAELYREVLEWEDGDRKVDILNLRLGVSGLIDRYSEREIRDNLGRTVAALAQADAEDKAILVWAAGNAHGEICDSSTVDDCRRGGVNAVSPDLLAGLAVRIEELRGHSIAVVAMSPVDGRIVSLSNRCGIAADFCIAAPGRRVQAAYFGRLIPWIGILDNRAFLEFAGSSAAGAMVSGGLAIMKQLFRGQLSSADLVTRLFETADRSGFYADAAIYGQGMMDLGAATSPAGVLEVPAGATVGGNGFRLLSTSISPGPALGDGLRRSLAAREVMAVDRMGAPFWYRLGDFTGAPGGPTVSTRLRSFLAPAGVSAYAGTEESLHRGSDPGPGAEVAALSLHATWLEASSEVLGSHMSLAEGAVRATLAARGGVSASAFTTKGLPGQRPAVGAALSWRRAGSPWGLRAGWIGEPRTLLGSVGEGAFGGLAADTSFLGVDAHKHLGGWRVGANAEVGLVVPDARGGFVERVSSLATSAFALRASRTLAGAGAVRLSVSQPLRVERGNASLTVPVARTKAGAVSYDAVTAALAPSGRQVDISGEWLRPLPKGELRLGAVYSHRPGHRQDAGPELTFLAGWRRTF